MTGIIALKEILADEVKLTSQLKNIASRFADTRGLTSRKLIR
jgi:hypothetical protein